MYARLGHRNGMRIVLDRCNTARYVGRASTEVDVHAPVAQLDRALVYGTKGRRFESCWARSVAVAGTHGSQNELSRIGPAPMLRDNSCAGGLSTRAGNTRITRTHRFRHSDATTRTQLQVPEHTTADKFEICALKQRELHNKSAQTGHGGWCEFVVRCAFLENDT